MKRFLVRMQSRYKISWKLRIVRFRIASMNKSIKKK